MLKEIIKIPAGLTFDFTNMFGRWRLDRARAAEFLQEQGPLAEEAIKKIRSLGEAKKHLSKDGSPEPVYFMKMPYVEEGNPNTPETIAYLKAFGERLKEYNAVIFLGIGGSYLGSKVLMRALGGLSWNSNSQVRQGHPRIFFAGNNLDSESCNELLETITCDAHLQPQPRRVMLIPISKSGTTLETMCGFLFFYEGLSKKQNIALDCAVVTDLQAPVEKSPLLQLAKEGNWPTFDIKEGIGGRFSVMTDVGLLCLAAMGADIDKFLAGARDLDQYCQSCSVEENPALINATLKYLAYGEGRTIEVFMPYAMGLKPLSEWYVQLLAESLGKRFDRKGWRVHYGRTPIVAVGTTDMHAQTQQHQDGARDKVIQFIEVDHSHTDIVLENPFPHVKEFAKVAGLSMHRALKVALKANEKALTSDDRYSARFIMPEINEYYLGQIMYFLMLSVAYEGELADVDAYDQPGVEVYKRYMRQAFEE